MLCYYIKYIYYTLPINRGPIKVYIYSINGMTSPRKNCSALYLSCNALASNQSCSFCILSQPACRTSVHGPLATWQEVDLN